MSAARGRAERPRPSARPRPGRRLRRSALCVGLCALAAVVIAPPAALGQVITATFSPDSIDEGATKTLTITYTRDCPGCDRVRFSNGSACAASLVNIGTIEFALSTSDPDTVTGTGSGSVTAGSVSQDTSCQPATQVHRGGTWFSGVSPSTFTIRNVVPAYSGAAVNGSTLTVSFDNALDTAHTPDTGDFTVAGGDSPSPTVTAVGFKSGDATKVELTLSRAVEYGETGLTLGYTPNAMDAKKLQDADDVVAAFSGEAVTNDTPYVSPGQMDFATPGTTTGTNPPGVPASATVESGTSLGEITVAWTQPSSGPAAQQWRVRAREQGTTGSFENVANCAFAHVNTRTCSFTGFENGASFGTGKTYEIQLRLFHGASTRDLIAQNVAPRSDLTAPAFSSAAVNGSTLTVTFGEALATARVPRASSFTVTGGDLSPAPTVTGVAVRSGDATKLDLTLERAVDYGETGFTVSYAMPGGVTRRLQDAAGNYVAAFSSKAVTNSSPFPGMGGSGDFVTVSTVGSPPAITAAVQAGPGSNQMTVTWSGSGVVRWRAGIRENDGRTDWTWNLISNLFDVTSLMTTGNSHTFDGCQTTAKCPGGLTLRKGEAYDFFLYVEGSTNAVRRMVAANVVARSDAAPPDSAAVNGKTLTVTFGEALDTAHVPYTSSFTVSGGNSPAPRVTGAAFKTGDATKLELTLSRAVVWGETGFTVSYAKPGAFSRRLQDAAANEVAAFMNQAVTNNSPYVPPTGATNFETPGTTSGTNPPGVPASATATPGPGDGQITVTWELPSSGTQPLFWRAQITESSPIAWGPVMCGIDVGNLAQRTCTFSSLTPGAAYNLRLLLLKDISDADGIRTLTASNIIAKDSTIPAVSMSQPPSVVDSTLTVTFNEALDTAHLPGTAQFTFPGVTPALAVQAVRFLPGDATKLELTLSRAVLGTETGLKLTYTQPGALQDRLQDNAGNFVPAATGNDAWAVDVKSIAITEAAVNGTALTLTANQPLDESFTPPNASFSVTARSPGGTSRTIAGAGGTVGISGRTVTVTLAEAVAWDDDTVTAAYVVPPSSQKPLIGMGGSGTPLPGFTGLAALNGTPPPLVGDCTSVLIGDTKTSPNAPSCTAASGPGPGEITLGWEPAGSGPAVERWHVSFGEAGAGDDGFTRVSDAGGLGADVRRFTVPASRLTPGDAYDVRLRAEGTNGAVAYRVMEASNVTAAEDTTAPRLLETGGLTVDGATLTLAYDEALDTAHVPSKLYFDVEVAGREQAPRVTALRINPDDATKVELTLSPAVRSGETVTLSYRKGHDPDPLQDAHGNKVADFAGRAVTNATAANVEPQLVSARVDATRTVMTLTFDEALDESSVPSKAAFFAATDYDTSGAPTRTVIPQTVAISGAQVRLTLPAALATGKEWRFHYRADQAGTSPLRGKVSGVAVTQTFDRVLVFAPTDRPHVTALAIVSTPDHTQGYGQGQEIRVALTFNEKVEAHRNIGNGPDRWDRSQVKIRLGPGRGTRWALYKSSSVDKMQLFFGYTLQPTDMTPTGETPGGVAVLEDSLNQEFCRIYEAGLSKPPRPSVLSEDDATCASGTHAGLPADPSHKVGFVGTMAADRDAPELQGAVALGDTLTFSFDEELKEAAVPDAGALTVRVKRQGSTARQQLPAKTLTVSGSRVVARLYDGVPHGATVTVKYDPPADAAKKLQDEAGNAAAEFLNSQGKPGYTAVRNNTPLAAVLDASVKGTALTLAFDQDLDADSTPRNGAFRVTATPAGGQSRTISGAAGDVAIGADKRTVTVTLASTVAGGETVTARYTPPSGSAAKLEDASGNALAAFDGKSVFNATPPLPTVFAASVKGTALTIEFDRELDTDSTPRNSAFRVTATPAGGTARTIAGAAGTVAIGADKLTVTVTLAQVVHGETTVTARYTPPSGTAAKLRDASGNAVAAFDGEEVVNATPPLPSMYAAEVTGTALTLEFDRELDTDSAPRNGAFRVTAAADGRSRTVAGAAGDVAIGADKRTVTVTLAQRVVHGETATARYTPPSGTAAKLQDAATGYAVAAFDGEEVFNATAALSSVLAASVDGTALALTFDKDLDTARLPRNAAFRVTATPAGGTARTIAGAAGTVAVDASKRRVAVTLARAVAHGETVTVRYTPPAGSAAKLQNAAGLALAAFDVDPVHNATLRIGTAMDFGTPGTATGTNPPGVPASATVTPGPGPGEITVTWTNPTSGPVPTSWNTYARPAGLNVGWGPYVGGPCIGKLPDS